MKFIGITGGVGAGKSAILDYLDKKEGVKVILADQVAHLLMEPGKECYNRIVECFKEDDLLDDNACFDRFKLANVIFSDERKRDTLNGIVHPAVKEYIKDIYALEKKKGKLKLLVLEAALLIEEDYDEICDELWYIYTSRENRRNRLKSSRGYSDEKVDNIFNSQLSENEYRNACKEVIDNNGSLEETYNQIESALSRSLKNKE